MNTNDTNADKKGKLIYPDLSYRVTGICFEAHNQLGRFSRERQYSDKLAEKFTDSGIPYQRECPITTSGNIVDFLIENKIILEVKAKSIILKDDFYQVQRYLQSAKLPLALLVNFRNRYLRPIRVVRIDTPARARFL